MIASFLGPASQGGVTRRKQRPAIWCGQDGAIGGTDGDRRGAGEEGVGLSSLTPIKVAIPSAEPSGLASQWSASITIGRVAVTGHDDETLRQTQEYHNDQAMN